MARRVHVTTDLEDEIRKEMAQLDEQLRGDGLDGRVQAATALLHRREALRWVLTRAGVRA